MGERMRAALAAHPGLVLAGALEAPGHPRLGERVAPGVVLSDDLKAGLAAADVAVAFAPPAPTLLLLEAAADAAVPCVVGTTGFSAADRARIERLAVRLPVVLAANFSVAVNVLVHLTRRAAALLGGDYQAEVLELHHAAKLDAPSGTALRLGAAVAEGRGESLEGRAVFARQGETGPRPPGAIGFQTLRGGDSPGEHTVLFLGSGERLELVHRSMTRDHFARGALRAAAWLRGRPPGLYDMEQVLGLRDVP
jgi:4-hydroxy-tetrahydrodipicolinate reductase